MHCLFGQAKWWLVDVRKSDQDGIICQIVVDNPSESDAQKIIEEMLGPSAEGGSLYIMHWHHGHGVFNGNLNKTEQVYDGLCC